MSLLRHLSGIFDESREDESEGTLTGSTFAHSRRTLRHNRTIIPENLHLMNDWEIGGTQNKWVCPSDRHLQLRAQLKSGWSVRTATARSPTNSKGNSTITEAEQEHIKQVLAKAEASRLKNSSD
ncbi:Transcription factor rbf1 (RPG-box-binding factor) (Repressor-activator protein 1) [Parelaphostrongylus tenuis]|uniref:Transcription factor rbf1 (RPG-box-binding factor) (Repressor-activator protein 1) n=1 Tax=Parelaphostrongylus tenuis TaxID=148309 RepID=A0AAD5RFV7_PARTN|nr:Transcription factor rbf1 (RPG-box-binding factor) (Repressor-activator protein 1) [Parelaphostrongylus tenuis]